MLLKSQFKVEQGRNNHLVWVLMFCWCGFFIEAEESSKITETKNEHMKWNKYIPSKYGNTIIIVYFNLHLILLSIVEYSNNRSMVRVIF